jgi:hypothetical protein
MMGVRWSTGLWALSGRFRARLKKGGSDKGVKTKGVFRASEGSVINLLGAPPRVFVPRPPAPVPNSRPTPNIFQLPFSIDFQLPTSNGLHLSA